MPEPEASATHKTEQKLALEEAVHSQSPEILSCAAQHPALTEELALALLKHPDLPSAAVESLSKNGALLKQRKVRVAVASYPRTPRHISLPLLRHLYTLDLMHVALTPVVPADVKKVADETLVTRLGTVSSGEKMSLARRASGRIAEQLLLEKETRIMDAALENPRLTEISIVKTLTRADASAAFVQAVCHHVNWSQRREVRIALLRNQKTPLARALEFAQSLSLATLKEILNNSRLPAAVKSCLLNSKATTHPR